jgi:hypothetical protein
MLSFQATIPIIAVQSPSKQADLPHAGICGLSHLVIDPGEVIGADLAVDQLRQCCPQAASGGCVNHWLASFDSWSKALTPSSRKVHHRRNCSGDGC